MKWNKFLRNAKNKEELININVKFIKSNKLRQLINSPFIVTAENKIYRFEEGQEKINECNHEEADTRIILLASQGTNDVVVVAKKYRCLGFTCVGIWSSQYQMQLVHKI